MTKDSEITGGRDYAAYIHSDEWATKTARMRVTRLATRRLPRVRPSA